ncbi:Bax inhibitor-1/YccA family protein [[Clostridium] symbiosum]|uniref:Bax inhibitor-1/YccA family protein n=1 Tax=Clostridium symbiosum TaxID=1512 RepID=UPI001D07375A|nr:Bax inhibitor-1/YccA family protein [[Clostridium] symbiosum]MCB6607788.1 Bax inhibitor-1/YccA family protein [[Clostridium] symbiosum]MCB6932649.1 Bax inhibitor-1/YccA family protein [[Clostridium] symbiosum]
MDYEQMNQVYQAEGYGRETLGQYVAKTYLWMFAGLMLTFAVAVAGYLSGAILFVFAIPYGLIVISGLELLTVFWMSARVNKMSVGAARGMFLFYAALNGIVFSAYFLVFGAVQLLLVFVATSLFFGIMAGVSLIFKIDISGIRPLLVGGLFFLIIFGVLSMFLNLGAMETVMCYVGIAVFLGFTAYDTGKIRTNYTYFAGNQEILEKASIFSALSLYLDFINLFLYILRLLNRSRN